MQSKREGVFYLERKTSIGNAYVEGLEVKVIENQD